MVKFIEVGRVYPASFQDKFKNVCQTVAKTVKGLEESPSQEEKKKK